ncbi:hypothetical protein D3C72_2271070 [compost metagenome]
MRLRPVHASTPGSWMNAWSIDGTKCSVLMPYSPIRRINRAGSRCAPGGATTRRAPVISGQKNSHTDTSKLNGVFCNTESPPSSP